MLFRKGCVAALAAGVAVSSNALIAGAAHAHVSLSSGPGYVNQTQVLTFNVGHGCEGVDTASIEISIPSQLTSVRAIPNGQGKVETKKNDAGLITSVLWTNAEVHAADEFFYQVQIRAKVPDAAFTTLYIPVKQICKKPDGSGEVTVDWAAVPKEGEAPAGEDGPPPAAELHIFPVRQTGWNQYTVKDKISDLAIFDDAQIVWSGDAAYSSNAETKKQITADATELTEIEGGATIWVKY